MQFLNNSRVVTLPALLASFLFLHSQFSGIARSEETISNNSLSNPIASHHPDVLQCAICRKRLGLPPLLEQSGSPAASTPTRAEAPVSGTTIRPNLPNANGLASITASSTANGNTIMQLPIPIEAKQKLLSEIQLPPGAKILSAQFIDAATTDKVPTPAVSTQNDLKTPSEDRSLFESGSQQHPPSTKTADAGSHDTITASLPEKDNKDNVSNKTELKADKIAENTPSAVATPLESPEKPSSAASDTVDITTRPKNSFEPTQLQPIITTPESSQANSKEEVATEKSHEEKSVTPEKRMPLGGEHSIPRPEQFNIDTTRTSIASIQIENEILKRQLIEREKLVEQLGTIHAGIERQLDEVTRNHEAVRKQSQQNQTDFDKERKELQLNVQKRDQYIATLKTELNNLRQQSHQEIMQLTDKIAEIEKTRTKEMTDITLELIELRDKYRATAAREADLQSVKAQREKRTEDSKNFDSINDQQKQIIDKQSKTILRLQKQIRDVQLSQREDESQVARLQIELSDALQQLRRYKSSDLEQNRDLPPPTNSPRQLAPTPKKNSLLK